MIYKRTTHRNQNLTKQAAGVLCTHMTGQTRTVVVVQGSLKEPSLYGSRTDCTAQKCSPAGLAHYFSMWIQSVVWDVCEVAEDSVVLQPVARKCE
jgi:hypothetical protein